MVLNYLPLVNQALQSASATISQLVGHQLTLPEITPDMIPAEAIQKLDSALGVTLPTDFGTLVVFNSDQLPKLQYAVNTARQGLFGLVALFFLSMVVAIVVSPRRRRTILQLAVAIAVVTVIERRLGISSVDSVVNIAKPENQAAVRAIAEALVGWFLDYTRLFLLLALLTVVVALLTGPYGWVVAFRRGVADLARNAVHTDGSVEAGPTSTWVAAHRLPVLVGIGVVAVGILWLFDLTIGWSFLVVLIGAALGFVAWRVLRPPDRGARGRRLGGAWPRRHGRDHHPEAGAAHEVVGQVRAHVHAAEPGHGDDRDEPGLGPAGQLLGQDERRGRRHARVAGDPAEVALDALAKPDVVAEHAQRALPAAERLRGLCPVPSRGAGGEHRDRQALATRRGRPRPPPPARCRTCPPA